jgi:predicted N-acyltransferase
VDRTSSPRFAAAYHPTISEVPEAEWNSLFPGSPEPWGFYLAAEEAPPDGAKLGAATVRDADGRLVAAAPCFRIAYRLDTPFQGRPGGLVDRLAARHPGFARLGVMGLGSPLSDGLSLGFATGLDAEGRAAALASLLELLHAEGRRRKGTVLALKSLAGADPALDGVLQARGYGRVTSVPVAMLPLPFATFDAYLDSLPRKMGAYLRRKRQSADRLRIEYRESADGLQDSILGLYQATLAQSGVGYGDFDRLPPHLIGRLLTRLGAGAQLMLCWHGNELVSFQVFLVGRRRIVAYKIGMRYPQARELNLYFVNWLEMIAFAIRHSIPEIEMGATTYAAKLLFGGHLERRYLHFRFRRPISNRLSRPFHHYFDFERNDGELQRLRAELGTLPGLDRPGPAPP